MTRLRVGNDVLVLSHTHKIISTERAIVELKPNTLWVSIFEEKRPVGIVFIGHGSFTAEAILETEIGALGESVMGELKGPQLLFGQVNLTPYSHPVQRDELVTHGFSGLDEFLEVARSLVDNLTIGISRVARTGKGRMLIGHDAHETKVILIASDDKVVFVRGKKTLAVSDNGLVAIDGAGVTITDQRGHCVSLPFKGHRLSDLFEMLSDHPRAQSCGRWFPPHWPHREHFWRFHWSPWYDWTHESNDWFYDST